MKRDVYIEPRSSFLGMAKDTSLIMRKILSSQNILRLMKYNLNDSKTGKPLIDLQTLLTSRDYQVTSEDVAEMLNSNQISSVPKIRIEAPERSYMRITYDSFIPNATNTFFRDHIVKISILCHFNNWDLGDFNLRPYRIAGEIDAMLDGVKLSGIGILNFVSADQDIYDEEYGGLTLRYLAVRGNEDKEEAVRPLK